MEKQDLLPNIYVREFDGVRGIGKLKYICDCEKCKERGWAEPVVNFVTGDEFYTSHKYLHEIKKVSFDIVDLLEENDVVEIEKFLYQVHFINNDIYLVGRCEYVYNTKLKTWSGSIWRDTFIVPPKISKIMTHEQFKSVAKEVEK